MRTTIAWYIFKLDFTFNPTPSPLVISDANTLSEAGSIVEGLEQSDSVMYFIQQVHILKQPSEKKNTLPDQ